jgi:transposase
MIDPEKRNAIYFLYTQGMGIKEISRKLQVDRDTVHTIIELKGEMPDSTRSDKIELDDQLLIRLYAECNGYIERMHEKLTEDHDVKIGYSTLTRMIRELGLGRTEDRRCDQKPDQPGAEMQHDTTVYTLPLGGKLVRVVCSLIYLRYSKMRYLKFYRRFNRFQMKCFLDEALRFWGFSAPICIIDNTNLARLRGVGKHAVMILEMEQFAKSYSFEFVCHEKGHSNRKAGNERSFYTVETNFLPGRKFASLTDLNQQALEWATVKMSNRPQSKSGLIPAIAFEYEQAYLTKLPSFLPRPYIEHYRTIDQYGYISFDGNYYWAPGVKRFEVQVLQYADRIKIYHQRQMLIEYQLPVEGVKNRKFSPPGQPQPVYQPSQRKKPTDYEEKKLRSIAEDVDEWFKFAFANMDGKQKHRLIRQLYDLHRKMSAELFIKTIQRALAYRIADIHTIERIAVLMMKEACYSMPQAHIDEELTKRPSFIEGRFTDDADFSVYRRFEEDNNG